MAGAIPLASMVITLLIRVLAKRRNAGRIRIEPPRHLYTVEIPEDNGMNYLYWDLSLIHILYYGDYVKAKEMAEAIMNLKQYDLEPGEFIGSATRANVSYFKVKLEM